MNISGRMKQMWVGIEGMIRNQAGKLDNEIAKVRVQNGKMVRRSKGKRQVPVEYHPTPGTPKSDTKCDTEFEEEINSWTAAYLDIWLKQRG